MFTEMYASFVEISWKYKCYILITPAICDKQIAFY